MIDGSSQPRPRASRRRRVRRPVRPGKKPKSAKDLNGPAEGRHLPHHPRQRDLGEIFKHLREDEIETLTFEIARLENVEPELKDAILMEFQELMMASEFITSGGIDYARELLEKALGSQKAIDIINRLTSSLQVQALRLHHGAPTRPTCSTSSRRSIPQTIALILAYLEPNKASYILTRSCPRSIQSDVAKRIATMDRTSPEVLREVERVLEKKLSTLSSEDYTAAGGVDAIVEILNLADRTTEKGILEALEEENPELAEEIKKKMFVFEDIVMLDNRSIQKVMREVDTQDLTRALKGVDTRGRRRRSSRTCPSAPRRRSRRTWSTWARSASRTWRKPSRRSSRSSATSRTRARSSSPAAKTTS